MEDFKNRLILFYSFFFSYFLSGGTYTILIDGIDTDAQSYGHLIIIIVIIMIRQSREPLFVGDSLSPSIDVRTLPVDQNKDPIFHPLCFRGKIIEEKQIGPHPSYKGS